MEKGEHEILLVTDWIEKRLKELQSAVRMLNEVASSFSLAPQVRKRLLEDIFACIKPTVVITHIPAIGKVVDVVVTGEGSVPEDANGMVLILKVEGDKDENPFLVFMVKNLWWFNKLTTRETAYALAKTRREGFIKACADLFQTLIQKINEKIQQIENSIKFSEDFLSTVGAEIAADRLEKLPF